MSGKLLTAEVSGSRIADDLWRLVRVPSPTTRERDAAMLFAGMLEDAGMEVTVDNSIENSPSVIGRRSGAEAGPTLQLAGHIDHIDVAHPEPERTPAIISGRGAADMKAGLAGMLEVVRILAGARDAFAGEILVTVYGLHEAPLGHAEGLTGLIERGVRGDAALVFEGPPDCAVICGKGQSIWNLAVTREGGVCHELRRPADADHLLDTVLALSEALRRENRRLGSAPHRFPLLGPESYFIGQIHYGDFYNRAPDRCQLQGTRRWHPTKSFADVKDELDHLIAAVEVPPTVRVETDWTFVGESYSVDADEPVVQALRDAYRERKGADMPIAGVSSILDTSRLVPIGGVPTVPLNFDGETAHADREYVRLDLVEESCRLALATVLRYLAPGRVHAGARRSERG